MASAVVRVGNRSTALSSRRGDCDESTREAAVGAYICLSSWPEPLGCAGKKPGTLINGTLDYAPGIDTMRRLVSAPVWPTVERIGRGLSESNATFN